MEREEKNGGDFPAEFAAKLPRDSREGLLNLANACAKSILQNGSCEWVFVATQICSRLERRGVKLSQLQFVGEWKTAAGSIFSARNGEFALHYCGRDRAGTVEAVEKIRETLRELSEQNAVSVENEGRGGAFEPFWWIRAKILYVEK